MGRNGKEILQFTNILAENKSKQTEIEKNQENNVNNLEKRIVEVENGVKHIDDTLDGLNSIQKMNEESNREVKEYIEKEISSHKILINSIYETENNVKVSEARTANIDDLEKMKDTINRDSNSMIRNIDERLKEVMEEKTSLLINLETLQKETHERLAD